MPSQRPSRLARAPPNGAHENRQSMYPGVQARGSDAEDSDLTRRPYHTYSELIGSDHGDEERNSPMAPPRGDTFTDSGYGSGIGRSHPSQSSLSNSTLFPEGSDRSSGTNPSHNASVPHDRYPFGRTDRDRLYEQDPNMVWSRLSGWHSRTTGPYPPPTSQASSGYLAHRCPSSSSSDSYDDADEDPYTIPPQRSRHDDDDEDPYTIPPQRSRYDNTNEEPHNVPPQRSRYENDDEDHYITPPQRSRYEERHREERYRRSGHY